MLTFDQKRAVFSSFPELIETKLSNGRINFVFRGSQKRRKVIARELHPNGNGYVYGGYLSEYPVDSRGWVKKKNFSEDELRSLIGKVISSMSKP